MNTFSVLVVGSCALVMVGCTRVYHAYGPNHAAGASLPIEVTLAYKPDDVVSGTVFYRPAGQGQYRAVTMKARADQLWAVLPTEQYAADEKLQYYLDVSRKGKLFAFGSPAAPYVVTFLAPTDLILANLSDGATSSDTEHPVIIALHANGQPIDQPTAIYQMPGVPGDIRAPMQPDRYGNYSITIPHTAVSAGRWQYAIEVPLDGKVYRRPAQGYRTFSVTWPEYSDPVTIVDEY